MVRLIQLSYTARSSSTPPFPVVVYCCALGTDVSGVVKDCAVGRQVSIDHHPVARAVQCSFVEGALQPRSGCCSCFVRQSTDRPRQIEEILLRTNQHRRVDLGGTDDERARSSYARRHTCQPESILSAWRGRHAGRRWTRERQELRSRSRHIRGHE